MWVYALLFLIVFVETGVVVMPFCRGFAAVHRGRAVRRGPDEFSAGVRGAHRGGHPGRPVQLHHRRYFGPKVFQWEDSRWFNKRAFNQAHDFYERYGGITIVIARFMPSFAPLRPLWRAWRK